MLVTQSLYLPRLKAVKSNETMDVMSKNPTINLDPKTNLDMSSLDVTTENVAEESPMQYTLCMAEKCLRLKLNTIDLNNFV